MDQAEHHLLSSTKLLIPNFNLKFQFKNFIIKIFSLKYRQTEVLKSRHLDQSKHWLCLGVSDQYSRLINSLFYLECPVSFPLLSQRLLECLHFCLDIVQMCRTSDTCFLRIFLFFLGFFLRICWLQIFKYIKIHNNTHHIVVGAVIGYHLWILMG